ncbi:MAG: hypothetical protein ACREX4_18285 [Gammaproteobacteria bacterium]
MPVSRQRSATSGIRRGDVYVHGLRNIHLPLIILGIHRRQLLLYVGEQMRGALVNFVSRYFSSQAYKLT